MSSYTLNVFVSSTCFDLKDFRAVIKKFLEDQGIKPFLSDEKGFPQIDGVSPYVSCLKVLETCPMIICAIDRRYGTTFQDWRPYPEYNGLSPIHAELKHALTLKKKLLLFVSNETMNIYYHWVKKKEKFGSEDSRGIEIKTLELIEELQGLNPKPWIRNFDNVTDVVKELQMHLLNEVYASLKEKEKENQDQVQYLMDKILELAPEVRSKIEEKLNADQIERLNELNTKYRELEEKFKSKESESNKLSVELQTQKASLTNQIAFQETQIKTQKVVLFNAAVKDASWLTFVRSRLMDKQPGRVPFHSSGDVALRGFHVGSTSNPPLLKEVTWSKLPNTENKLHRGYHAGLIFKGENFAPGVTWASRKAGETAPPSGQNDYWWRSPNIYFGDYLEVSTNADEFETPLGDINMEYCVKNSEGKKSQWVKFSYPFDFKKLNQILDDSESTGRKLFDEKKYQDAVEPLRKAYVFSDRLNGESDPRTKSLSEIWNRAIDNRALSRMRFKKGDKVKVVSGEHTGKTVQIVELALRATKCYLVQESGESKQIYLADDEVADK